MTSRSLLWFAVLAALAINLHHVSAQLDNTIVSRRSTINSTLSSFSTNVVNKVNDYTNKFTSLRNDMSGQLRSASDTLTSFLSDQQIGDNALLASDVLSASSTTLSSSVTASLTITATFSTVGTCLNTKTQASVSATFSAFSTAHTSYFNIITSSTSPYLSTCRSRFANTANDLVNQCADRVQDCLNDENNELSRVSSILNNFMTLMRQHYQGLTQHIRSCSSLGSTTSRAEVKAEINACLKGIATYVAPLYRATIAQQFQLVNTMLQLEVVASNNRVKTCINQVTNTYTAMAEAIVPALNQCLQTGQSTTACTAEYARSAQTDRTQYEYGGTCVNDSDCDCQQKDPPVRSSSVVIASLRITMGMWSASIIFLIPLLCGLGNASPDLGLDISIDYVTMNNPNVLSSANMVGSATSDLQGAIGGYQVAKLNGSTSLVVSGEALVSLVGNITVNVNEVLRNISIVASQRQTAPSCMFASMNATIDRAFVALDMAGSLISRIQTSTSSQTGGALTSWMAMIQTAMTDISTYLDTLYKEVTAVMAAGPLSAATVANNIKPATLFNLAGAISVVTTAEKGLTTTVRSIRSAFEQASNILNSYSTDMTNALTSVNNTQRDYYNQVVNRITSYKNKVTWEAGWGVTDIVNRLPRVNPFMQDSTTRTTALQLNASITTTNTAILSQADIFANSLQSQMTLIFTGAEAFVQTNVKSLVPVFDTSLFKLAATMSVGGTYAGNCNGKYGGAITNLENNMRDGLQKCFNDYANTGYTDSFISEYNMVLREQTRSIANRIDFCLNLGSTTSTPVIKAGISKCLSETVTLSEVLIKDLSIQTKLVVSMINLESLAMVQRVESCGAILNHGLVAKATTLDTLLATYQWLALYSTAEVSWNLINIKAANLLDELGENEPAEPQPQLLSGLTSLVGSAVNGVATVLNGVATGFAAGTSGSLSASGSLSGGVNIGGITIGAGGTFNSNLPILNLVNNVVTSTLSALNTAISNIGSTAGTVLTNALATITNTLNSLLGGVSTSLGTIGSGLSGAPTTANGQAVINALNNVATAVNSAVNAASSVFGSTTVAGALGNLTATLNTDLAAAIQAINSATANPGAATTLLGALGPNGINTIATFLGDAAGVLYTTANIPLQLTAAARVNATLTANAGVPYSAAGIAAVNGTVNAVLANANNVLNAAVGSFVSTMANVQPATNAALAQATATINTALSNLNRVFNLLAANTKTSVTTAAQLAVSNLTDLVSTLQSNLSTLNTVTLNAIVSANASIAADASAIIGVLVENLGSTDATVVACSQTYLPLAVRTNVLYTTALGSCAVEATTIANILVGNTIAVVNSAATRIRSSTADVTLCISAIFPSTLCRTATVPNAPAYITNVALDVANIKTGEVLDVANTANEVALCASDTANAAATDFGAIATAYDQCLSA
uniref:Protein TsetseEP domain-containing protein n=1 Tax=Anopheles minimus TaxID=112268 RepID=A0A182W6X8_9DIPT